jgi:hypothetical protein
MKQLTTAGAIRTKSLCHISVQEIAVERKWVDVFIKKLRGLSSRATAACRRS